MEKLILLVFVISVGFSLGDELDLGFQNITTLLDARNLLDPENKDLPDKCQLSLLIYLGGLAKFRPWALQMFDATAKIPEGIIYANHEFLGQYDECLAVIQPNNTFKGQHCVLEGELQLTSFPGIPANQKSVFFYGLCLPSLCSASDLNKALVHVEKATKGLLTINARDDYCHTTVPKKLRTGDGFVIALFCLLAVFGCFSTLYDYVQKSNGKKPHPILASFSIYTNSKGLFRVTNGEGQMQCLNGIRVMSMMWIVFFHTFTSIVAAPVINLTQAFSARTLPIYSVLVSAYLAVDSMLLMSGFLLALSFFKTMSQKGTYDIPMGYVHRYFRVTPSYAIILLFQVTLFQYIGDGPMWTFISNSQIPVCEKYWWSGLLYIQNYVNPDELCLTQTWYVSADMQLYWLSPLLLYPMWRWRKFAPVLISFVTLIFTFLPFALAYTYDLAPIALMDKTGDQNRIDNYPTHSRAAPWLVGVALAYLVADLKEKKITINFSKQKTFVGWLLAGIVGGLSLFGLLAFESNGTHNFDAAFYLAFHRLGWSLALAWLIFACTNKMGGAVDGFLSWEFFQPLAKLTYGVYLSHITVIFYRLGIFRTNIYFSLPELFIMGISIWVIAHFVAILLYLFIEAPFFIIERHLFNSVKILQLPRPKPKSNVET